MNPEHERLKERAATLKGERDEAKSAYVTRMEKHEAMTKVAEAEITALRGVWGDAGFAFEQAEKALAEFGSRGFIAPKNPELGT